MDYKKIEGMLFVVALALFFVALFSLAVLSGQDARIHKLEQVIELRK